VFLKETVVRKDKDGNSYVFNKNREKCPIIFDQDGNPMIEDEKGKMIPVNVAGQIERKVTFFILAKNEKN
jgi:hypothetical protein